MGADYPGQEKAIEELRNMSEEAREFLCHHWRNSLAAIGGNAHLIRGCIEQGKYSAIPVRAEAIESAMNHIIEDLKKIGC